jgi:hypothetical protein
MKVLSGAKTIGEIAMTTSQATAEVFLTAFRALPKKEQQTVLALITEDKELREDLLDMAVLTQRQNEPSRPFREFIAEQDR